MLTTRPLGLRIKLFTLITLILSLLVLPEGAATRTGNDACIAQYNSCNAQCPTYCDPASGICFADAACEMACNDQLAQCNGGGPAQPLTPCEGCLLNCDQMQQSCLADGTAPATCLTMKFKCRQRCNTACIY